MLGPVQAGDGGADTSCPASTDAGPMLSETARLLRGAHVAPSETAMLRLLKGGDSSSDAPSALKALAAAAGGEWVVVTGGVTTDEAGARFCTVLFRLGAERWESVRVPVQGWGETVFTSVVTQIWDRLRRLLAKPPA